MDQQTYGEFGLQQIVEYVCGIFCRSRRKVATAAVGVLALWLGFHVIFGANGMLVYQHKRAEYKKLQIEMKQLEDENQRLNKQVDELRNDPKAIEREAREQLHYTKPGEKVYLFPEQRPSVDKTGPNAAAELKR